MRVLGYLILFILAMAGCSGENGQFGPLNTAIGTVNQLVVVCDDKHWEGAVGDSVDTYFGALYPVLPRPEPLFDLKHFNANQISADPLRRELRTYMILASREDTSSATYQLFQRVVGKEKFKTLSEGPLMLTGRNKWARDQILFLLLAPSDEELASSIQSYFPNIASKINQHDTEMVKDATYLKGIKKTISNKIKTALNISIDIPGDYIIAKEEHNLIWLRKDVDVLTSNIVIMRLQYQDTAQFSAEYIKKVRNDFGRDYVETDIDSAYMVINDVDLPMYSYRRKINDNFALEARGIWEMENDFMGGPFISYLIHDEKRNELIFYDGFVLAPGKNKRFLMQQLEQIAKTIQFD